MRRLLFGGTWSQVAGCRILGDPGTSTGSLVGRVTVLKTLLPTRWQVQPDPGISAGYWQAGCFPGGSVVKNSPAKQ